MPQLNKGGKFVFGLSVIHPDLTIHIVWLGGFLAYTAGVYFMSFRANFPVLAVFMLLSIGFFAVGAGLISGFFSVNESKYIVTTASKIHGISAAIRKGENNADG